MTQTPEPPTATDPDPADASAVIDPPRPVALVTGGTRGIGAAIARSLAPDHRVLIGGRDARAAAALATELPDAEPFVVDLNDARATAEAVDTCAALADGLDVLVHSAGVYNVQPVTEATREDWRQVLETNLVAVADLTRLLLPVLRSRKGMVVAINSGAGMTPAPRHPVFDLQVRTAWLDRLAAGGMPWRHPGHRHLPGQGRHRYATRGPGLPWQ